MEGTKLVLSSSTHVTQGTPDQPALVQEPANHQEIGIGIQAVIRVRKYVQLSCFINTLFLTLSPMKFGLKDKNLKILCPLNFLWLAPTEYDNCNLAVYYCINYMNSFKTTPETRCLR